MSAIVAVSSGTLAARAEPIGIIAINDRTVLTATLPNRCFDLKTGFFMSLPRLTCQSRRQQDVSTLRNQGIKHTCNMRVSNVCHVYQTIRRRVRDADNYRSLI